MLGLKQPCPWKLWYHWKLLCHCNCNLLLSPSQNCMKTKTKVLVTMFQKMMNGSDMEDEDQPALGDISNESMQLLLGNVTTEPDPDNPLTVHGLNWVLEDGISMDECKEQPKHIVVNFQ